MAFPDPRRALAAVAVLATALTGCAVDTAAAAPASPLAWQSCGDDGSVQCATLSVPVDHDRPDGERLDLAVARLPAQDPATRRGTIVFHVGGPGPVLRVFLDAQRRAGFAELTRWFDVVTFDSRGYGLSTPICDPALAPPIAVLDSAEVDAAHRQRTAAYGESCRAGHPTLAAHAGAADTAHDIDEIRAALGEEQILYYGNSFGTVFGQEYAERYGHRLQRLYLDSVADHTVAYLEDRTRSAGLQEAALHRFADECATDPECPLQGEDLLAVWDEVLAAAERRPLPAADGSEVTAFEIRALSGNLVAIPDYRNRVAAALVQARDGDGSGFLALTAGAPPTGDAGQLTDCASFPVREDHAQLTAAADRVRQDAPRIGWATLVQGSWWCAGWPITAADEPAPLHAPDAPPALVVNATDDPGRTNILGARHVADQIEGSAVLPVTGYGHALYLSRPDNRCLRDAVHRYFLDGELPAAGAECPL
jgi:pimeloyl-ACP methyl ester carboxylesterase